MIRIIPFEPKYTEQMLEVARVIHARSIYFDLPMDEDKLVRQLSASGGLAADRYFRMAVEDDLLMAVIYGCLMRTFFSDAPIIKDMGQWSLDDGRQLNSYGLLLSDFEEWGRSQGAKLCCLGYSGTGDIEVLRRIHEYHGYRVTGYNTAKEL